MSFSTAFKPSPRANKVEIGSDVMRLSLVDGRSLEVPLEWFPTLRDASPDDRRNVRIMGDGGGLHWPALDEDLSVAGLLGVDQKR